MTTPPDLRRRTPGWLLPGLVGVNLAVAAWLLWRALFASPHGDPLATSLLALEKQNRLTVFSAQLSPVVAADDARLFGMLKSRQVAVIPARVDYGVDLSAMGKDRLTWDPVTQQLSVRLPPVQVSAPNLDEARAQYLREGVWITADAQTKLTRDNSLLAQQQAVQQAQNPVLMDLARQAARQAVSQNLAIPLAAAGYDRIRVTVRFDGEPAPGQ